MITELTKKQKYNKYRVGTKDRRTYKGVVFASIKEMNRYKELELYQKSGVISELELQVPFVLYESFANPYTHKKEREIKYIADFMYIQNNEFIVEDVKGIKTEAYKIKRKMFIAIYGNEYKFIET